MTFYEAPTWLDWAQVRRVGRQKQEPSTDGLHEVTDGGDMMGAEVVQHDDIAGIQSWTQGLTNKFDEARTIDGADKGLVT